ncbi:MAG: DNA polymerase III subunit gamma/tau, partial [Chitinophagaceae bacterium]|nr:DNA polymerase III subunit gamma/tau [Chitinophagaceae bacterium]
QKFIEQEKTLLIDLIQTSFKNRAIKFDIIIDESNPEQKEISLSEKLNSKQIFNLIAEIYPLVNELKERLKLDIDY